MSILTESLPKSKYFSLEQLAEGIYAAISIPGTGSWANTGIIDIGDQTIIFDTFATPKAAEDLRATAEQLTGRKAQFVINSHQHIDHVHGNQVFTDAIIISTNATRSQIADRQPRFIEMVKNNPEYLEQMRIEIEQETNPAKRRESEILLGEFTAIESESENSILTLPTITFDDKVILFGSLRSAQIITFGGGHSVSDTFLYLPEDQILFLADLMHIGYHADFRQGNVDEWIKILDKLKELDVKTIVSGHGTIGTAEDLITMQNYLYDFKQISSEWSQNGGTVDNINEIAIPEKYSSYGAPSVFYGNIHSLLNN